MILSATPYGIPEGRHMIPGKTYVGILPGHTRPAFVRKRPVDAGRPPLLLTQVFGSSRRAYSIEAPRKPNMFCRPRSDVYYDYATAKYRPKVYVDQSPGRTITSIQQTCASCGKFRSARWQSQHPLIPGKAYTPGLCGRCRDKHTSSEEERPRHRRRRHHHHQRCIYTESTDDSCNTGRESRRAARRHRSYSRDYRRRSPVRPPSREKVRIIIANQTGDRIRPAREVRRSSSMEPIRVVRRTEVFDLPERPPRTRSVLRSSSRTAYVDSATQYIENLDPPRYLPRPRTLSRVSYIEEVERPRYHSKPRSMSHVSYVEERPRYRSRPRSVSRVSYVEGSDRPRLRRRARSSSQVRFVDETDEPVSPPKPRRLKRRRVVYFDGPADTKNSEQQAYSCTPSNHGSSQGTANGDRGAVPIEEIDSPSSRVSEKRIHQDHGAESIEKYLISHRRSSSPSQDTVKPIHGTVSDHNSGQPSETRCYANQPDHEATLRPAFRHAQVIQSSDDVEESRSHRRPYPDLEGGRSDEIFRSQTFKSREPNRQRILSGPEIPYRGRRERVRESDESSASDDDDYPRPSPINYRHVKAPEPPEPPARHTDLLVEMLQNATITPPSTQYARGRPSHRNHSSEPDTLSRSYTRRFSHSEDSEDEHARYEGRRMAGERPYGGPSMHKPELRNNAEYNWMT